MNGTQAAELLRNLADRLASRPESEPGMEWHMESGLVHLDDGAIPTGEHTLTLRIPPTNEQRAVLRRVIVDGSYRADG